MDGVERVKSARQIKEEALEAKMQARAPLARVVRWRDAIFRRSPSLKMYRMMKPDAHLLLLGVVAAMAAGVIFPAYGLVFSKVKNRHSERSNPRPLAQCVQVITTLSVPGYQAPANGLSGPNLYAFLFAVIGMGAFVSIATQVVSFETAGARLTKQVNIFWLVVDGD